MNKVEIGKKILRELSNHGFQGYFVGGVVRDIILGREISDVDIATDAKPDKVIEIFKTTVPIGLKHGTVLVIQDKINFEVTTFRSEGKYLDFRHPTEVKYISNLEEDLSRRDFTINAMAMDIYDQFIDPFEGRIAISQKIIRTVGNSKERFLEDPLRMLRAIRFASQLNFVIDDFTWDEIKLNATYLQFISNERIKIELDKIMQADYAHIGIELLYKSNIINWIKGLNGTKITNVDYYYIVKIMRKTKDPVIRWFLLLYQLDQEERQEIMNTLKFSNKEKAKVNQVFKAYSILNNEINIINIKKCLLETDDKTSSMAIFILWIFNRIDETEKDMFDNDLEKIKKELNVRKIKDLDIDGKDLITAFNFPEGPWIKDILVKLFNKVIFDNLVNKKSVLLEQALLIIEGTQMETKIENDIKKGLKTSWLGRNIIYYQTLDSTQSEAHNLAINQTSHGTIIIAGEQTKGRGRIGREWYSEKEKGIWMSIILRPSFNINVAPQITLLTSIVIYRTLKKMFDIESKIKWPNDIYINNKKSAGILCEAKEKLGIYYLIVGIGINTHKTEYPDMIKNKATSIEDNINKSPKRLEIIIELINEFEKAYEIYQEKGFRHFYTEYLGVMYGLSQKVLYNNAVGYIIGIDEDGHLQIKKEDEHIINISSGEIEFLF